MTEFSADELVEIVDNPDSGDFLTIVLSPAPHRFDATFTSTRGADSQSYEQQTLHFFERLWGESDRAYWYVDAGKSSYRPIESRDELLQRIRSGIREERDDVFVLLPHYRAVISTGFDFDVVCEGRDPAGLAKIQTLGASCGLHTPTEGGAAI